MAAEQTDRISELPELVLHCILSFLPIKDAARTSILSMRWRSMWKTLPYLNFCRGFLDTLIPGAKLLRFDNKQKRKNKLLLNNAVRIILRRSHENISIEKLFLSIPDHALSRRQKHRKDPLYFKLERWMSYIARSSLRELHLANRVVTAKGHYLPASILSAKSLTVLSLSGFSLMSLSSLDINFSSLRTLLLSGANLDDCIMNNLIIGSPLLENLKLNCCEGLEILCVTGLPKLKELAVYSVWDLKMLEIDAPELLDLSIAFPSTECRVNVNACALLSKLFILGPFLSMEWLHQFVSQCQFLEQLTVGSSRLKNIKISSDTLSTLALIEIENLVTVEITAPTLQKFTFGTQCLPTISINASDTLKIILNFFPWFAAVDLGHDELAKFLGYFNNFRTVTLCGQLNKVLIPKNKRDILLSPLCGTANLVLSLRPEEFVATELVEYMLWLSPRVESVSITSRHRSFPGFRDLTCAFLKFVYEEKNDQKDLSSSCCKCLPINCWRHCLVEVRVEEFEVAGEDEMTRMKNFFLEHVKNLKIVDASAWPGSLCDGLYTSYDELFVDRDTDEVE